MSDDDLRQVCEVWYVDGAGGHDHPQPTLFQFKIDAERFAREVFPDDDVQKRYARIYFRNVFTYGGKR